MSIAQRQQKASDAVLQKPRMSQPSLITIESNHSTSEISAAQIAAGMDVQGIQWEKLPFSRENYRAACMRSAPQCGFPSALSAPNSTFKEPRRNGRFYNFFQNTRRVESSITHFQLRNLVWATSKHDVYFAHQASIVHWDAAKRFKTQVLDLNASSSARNIGQPMAHLSTIIAKGDLAVAGGFQGEVVARNVKTGKLAHNQRISNDENAIVNSLDIFDGQLMSCNNDGYVRCFDLDTFQSRSSLKLDCPVNHATRQHNGKLACAVADDKLVHVLDTSNGKAIAQLQGHQGFSFATWWHPDGVMFASGSQDRTCRVWDVRNMSRSVCVLGYSSAVRSLRFSSCGRFMVAAEQQDFVHIHDVRDSFDTSQEIDLFGKIAGVSFTPSAETLYIAVVDRAYSGLLQYDLNAP